MIAGVGLPILTLLMGASMFVQQWLTPAQGDRLRVNLDAQEAAAAP